MPAMVFRRRANSAQGDTWGLPRTGSIGGQARSYLISRCLNELAVGAPLVRSTLRATRDLPDERPVNRAIQVGRRTGSFQFTPTISGVLSDGLGHFAARRQAFTNTTPDNRVRCATGPPAQVPNQSRDMRGRQSDVRHDVGRNRLGGRRPGEDAISESAVRIPEHG